MIRHPPRSTLFPSTSLFRSRGRPALPRRRGATPPPPKVATAALFQPSAGLLPYPYDVYLDRKSTRLNSSHGYISYAVFCLKKKILQENDAAIAMIMDAMHKR